MAPNVNRRAAVILAGGRSTRFGSADKAVTPLAGIPLIRHVANVLESCVGLVVINCRNDQKQAIGSALSGLEVPIQYAIDTEPDRGPLAGIARGLSEIETQPLTFVVACDMPFVEADVIDFLFERIGPADAAVPHLDNQWYQTTQAVFRTEPMLGASQDVLNSGGERIVETFDQLEVIRVPEEEIKSVGSLQTFENINTQAELTEAEEALTRRD